MAWKPLFIHLNVWNQVAVRQFGHLQYDFIQRFVVSDMNIENIEIKEESLTFHLWDKKFHVLT